MIADSWNRLISTVRGADMYEVRAGMPTLVPGK
jgi:hypothetical protein